MSHLALDDDSSSVHSSSTETMADVVVSAFGGDESDSEVDSDGGSQDGEGDVLDGNESRSVDSDSTGSLADFIAPDWEMADGEGFLAIEDDDYEDKDGGSTDKDEKDGDDDDDGNDRDDDRLKRACSPDTCDAPSGYSSPVDRLRNTIPRLEILLYRLRRLARESSPRRVNALCCTITGRVTALGDVGGGRSGCRRRSNALAGP